MYIKEILHYDKDAEEGDIVVSDGCFDLLCYAQPFPTKDCSAKDMTLSAFMAKNIMLATKDDFSIEKLQDGYYSYRLQGKIVDLKNGFVQIGDIFVKLDNVIPKDIEENEFIEFTSVRIDVIM